MMSKHSRRELLAAVAPRSRQASESAREHLLDEFVASTGYHRKYAIHLLKHPLTTTATSRKRKPAARRYDGKVQQALITWWRATNGMCSKRLVPYLPELVSALERHGEIHLDRLTIERLLSLSPATADRLLHAERERTKLHGLSTPKAGTLWELVPIRTGTQWEDAQGGFVEVD